MEEGGGVGVGIEGEARGRRERMSSRVELGRPD